tara:strand:+ start:284 stop:1033 length:750 start_codon:yes stop_codon:yes gene_type:complete
MNNITNIVVPMAGLGSRFSKVGFENPKPLIDVLGEPMISLVVKNLRPSTPHRFIFICQESHEKEFGLKKYLEKIAPGSQVKLINGITDGAACTVLEASGLIDLDQPLVIANCDQYIEASMDDYLNSWHEKGLDGYIMTMKANENKWSYVKLNEDEEVVDVVEKVVISDEATVGIYNFKKGNDFIVAAQKMIQNDIRVNGEFYVAPVYNMLIKNGYKVGVHNIGSCEDTMFGLGTPEDLSEYIRQYEDRQ